MSQPAVRGIDWKDWSEEIFTRSRSQGKPILLTLTATWCHWCHVMDQTTYADGQVINLVNSRYIPVRVDVDRRPDLSRKYNQGSLPSMALLNDRGELLAGQVYTPAEEMARFLEQTSERYSASPDAKTNDQGPPSPIRQSPSQAQSPVRLVLARLEELYDRDFGGFGDEPKQPPWEGLRFLLALYSRSGDANLLKMVVRTLDGMSAGLYDQKNQGFFRYSVARDWKVPHYEKMLTTNANLVMLYLEAYQATGKVQYKNLAAGALGYLLSTLHDPDQGFFYASQDAGEEYYRLPWVDRDRAAKPSIDRTFYTGWNALAGEGLIKASAVLNQPAYLATGVRILDLLWNQNWSWARGLSHVVGDSREQPPLLEDQVPFLRALISCHQATGDLDYLNRAIETGDALQRLFRAPDGGFFEVPVTDGGGGDKPVLENSLLAEAWIGLSYLTGEESYLSLARNALETFLNIALDRSYAGAGGSRRMEEDEERLFLPAGAAWGRAWEMLEYGPVQLVVVGSSEDGRTKAILKAANQVHAPHKITQLLDPEQDTDRIVAQGFPIGLAPALYACMGGKCLAPLTTAKDIRQLQKSRPWHDSPGGLLLSHRDSEPVTI